MCIINLTLNGMVSCSRLKLGLLCSMGLYLKICWRRCHSGLFSGEYNTHATALQVLTYVSSSLPQTSHCSWCLFLVIIFSPKCAQTDPDDPLIPASRIYFFNMEKMFVCVTFILMTRILHNVCAISMELE